MCTWTPSAFAEHAGADGTSDCGKVQSPMSSQLVRSSKIGKKRGIRRESSHFLGETADYLMEAE